MNRTQRMCLIGTAAAITVFCVCPPCLVENSRVGPGELGFVPVWELEARIAEYRATIRVDGAALATRCAVVLGVGLLLCWLARSKQPSTPTKELAAGVNSK